MTYPYKRPRIYTVSLVNAEVTIGDEASLESTPYKDFSNEHQAGYFALGICMQKISEKCYKISEIDKDEVFVDFTMLGRTHRVTRPQCIKGREILKTEYAEYFI